MADKQWPQNAPDAAQPIDDNTLFGAYNGTETGATKNVKFTGAELKAYAEGTLSADIAQNASDIADNTAAIGVNASNISDNTVDISGLDSRVSALEAVSLPVGTILTFDGTAWVDNSTIPGWYACISANAGVGCPNLVDSFIKGKAVATAPSTGGANSKTLSTANMPAHTHGGSAITVDGVGSHSHNIPITGAGPGPSQQIDATSSTSLAPLYVASDAGGAHSHTASAGATGSAGSGSAFDNQPAYYTLIYIRRCS